jgi:hypothetical protein
MSLLALLVLYFSLLTIYIVVLWFSTRCESKQRSLMCGLSVFTPRAAKQLVHELGSRFPVHQLMEALGMVYPQYWCLEDCRANYENHIQVIKAHYCHPKSTHHKISKTKKKGRKGHASIVVVEDKEGTNTNANGIVPLAL